MQHLKIHKIYIIQWKVCFFIYQSPPRVNKKYDKTQIKGLYTDGILTFRGFIAQNEVLHFVFSVQFKFLWSSQWGKTEVKLLTWLWLTLLHSSASALLLTLLLSWKWSWPTGPSHHQPSVQEPGSPPELRFFPPPGQTQSLSGQYFDTQLSPHLTFNILQ